MELPLIAREGELKGLDLIGTGDALHPEWWKHLQENLKGQGIYSIGNSRVKFLITTEVEDFKRVHQLILLPSLEAAEELREKFKKYSNNLGQDGRPNLKLSGAEIVDLVREVEGLVGPAHAFTPWTAVYKEYDSLKDCYQDALKHVKFLELGLSADTYLADRIPELEGLTFMSNSDTHSPWPHRLGREFNRLEVEELNFSEIEKAISREQGRKFTLNVGLNPQEGKYHLTSCTRCFLRFKVEDALSLKWRCPECRGMIKKGVRDRIEELAKWKEPHHPHHRPPYIHILPLAEVISLMLGITTIPSKKIEEKWDSLVKKFGSEINVLVDADVGDIKKEDLRVGKIIEKFRTGKMRYVPGGGGQYGKPALKNEQSNYWGSGQKKLGEF